MPDEPLESSIIRHLLRDRSRPTLPIQVDIGDDAAVLADGTTLTTDVLLEGVHFDDQISPMDLGWKTVAVNASDIAAMGATPQWALLGLSLPVGSTEEWVTQFGRGLHRALDHWSISLIGGDTTRSEHSITISLTVVGHCHRPLRRDRARIDDRIWVTGTLGDAAQGFFRGGESRRALHRPDPPVSFGAALAAIDGVHSAMDLSDGLAIDLARLCESSGLGAVIHPEALPASEFLEEGPQRLGYQVAFGEDYQLLFTAAPDVEEELLNAAHTHGISISCIGYIQSSKEVRLSGRAWPRPLFTHFRDGEIS